MGTLALALALAAVALAAPSQAAPLSRCADRPKMIEQLDRGYDESPRWLGLSSSGHVVEILVSPSGSWTILVRRPDGRSCIVDVGKAAEDMLATPPGKPS